MRKLIVLVALIALSSARSASAQAAWTAPTYGWGSGWCPTCYVFSNVDTPNLSTPFDGSIAGWAFECSTGQPIDRIDVYYSSSTEWHRADSYIAALNVERPDVLAYFAANGCPKVSSTTGWSVGFKTPIPSGTWRITVVVWKGMLSTTQNGLVVVP